MRQIKFRGKDIETGVWVYGSLVLPIGDTPRIYVQDVKTEGAVSFFAYEVEESTVGQSTGLLDKNGNEIYEGDVVTFDNHLQGVSQVVYDYSGFDVISKNYGTALRPMMNNHIRVIGNIHDNKELIKK